MTRIKIKTDLFRREITVENVASGSQQWKMYCTGFLPIRFEAATTGEAADKAEALYTSLSRDPDYSSNRGKRSQPPQAPAATAVEAPRPIAPLGKKAEKDGVSKAIA
jgi:hypothetical protein